MKLLHFAVAAGLAALPLVGVAAPASASAAPAVSCDEGDDAAFVFDSYDADFYLDTDGDGRSTLTTVETFVANFPDIDQNQGMRSRVCNLATAALEDMLRAYRGIRAVVLCA